jgi:hypothetical protein
VAYSWEKAPKPADLPNPELNPMLNPILGRNLGRWAQVYFTNPPEKRERAVVELLRELEGNRGGVESPDMGSEQEKAVLLCPACQQPNEATQKYCGVCGTSLRSSGGANSSRERLAADSADTNPSSREPVPRETDLQWMRERAAETYYYEADISNPNRWKYVGVGLVLVIVLAGLVYLERSPRSRSAPPTKQAMTSPSSSQQTDQAENTGPSRPPAPDPAQSEGKSPAAEKTATSPPASSPAPNNPDTAAEAGRNTPAVESASLRSSGAKSSPESGGFELLEAQRLLGSQDSSEAVKWLWKAVGKQNTAAEIALADLYTRGDGVSKNCEQARLLLVTAAKKGASDAAQKLRSLESNGCP